MIWEGFTMALTSLRDNKVRSLLTMLGIIIGVAAVITLVSIGMGVKERVESNLSSLGSNMIMVSPGNVSASGIRGAAGSNQTLTLKDAQAIEKSVDGVRAVAPIVNGSANMVVGNQNWISSMAGSTPEYAIVQDRAVAEGSFITDRHLAGRERVAVLGQTVVENLFGESQAIGRTVRINDAPFRVIGILEEKGQSGMGQDQDDTVIIPITTAQERMLGITHINRISIQGENTDVLAQIQADVTELLRQRHEITADKEDDFNVRNMTEMINAMNDTTTTITMLLGITAAISLLVGGIGIMNIMLVSVTERTREIGIRKSLGAKYNDIRNQFLIEASVICLVGGAIGIIFGIIASEVISALAGWNTYIAPWSILLSFGFSLAIGVFFGFYPARKAAKLDPIEALRYE
ncbi:MAG: ABC transporter permease [Selenomonadales bacterium]|nr:ABC transporter permease [Selenomonadales bacterium]